MQRFELLITPSEYATLCAHPATRLYQRRWNEKTNMIEFWTNKPYSLAHDLEQVIDFGAVSAYEMLHIPPKW